jgi:iron complex outermembrane receptor protein
LAASPGLSNASFGPAVGQPVVRGQQGARVSVLQNSLSSADAANISADHAVSVEPLLADSVEVLRGPSTLLYGGGAIGGVVNVIDNRIPSQTVDGVKAAVEYRHDSAGDMDSSVFRLDAGEGNMAIHLSGLYRDWNHLDIPGDAIDTKALKSLHEGHAHKQEEPDNTRGYIANTEGRTDALTAGATVFFDQGLAGFSVSHLSNRYGIPPAGHAHGHDEHAHTAQEEVHGEGILIDLRQTRYDGRLQLEQPLPGIEQLDWRLAYTDYQHEEVEPDGAIGTEYHRDSWESRLTLNHQELWGWHGVFGLQYKDSDFSAQGEESFIPETQSTGIGLFIVEGYDWQAWTFELGARYDLDSRKPSHSRARDRDFNSGSLSASALWQGNTGWQASLALSRSERAPVAEELYSNVDAGVEFVVHGASQAIEVGNSKLDSERSQNADFTLAWQNDSVNIEATAFYNHFNDYIYLYNTGQEQDELPVLEYQQQDARFYGIELDADWYLIQASGQQLTLGLFGDAIRGEFDNGEDVPRLPPLRLGAKVEYQWSDWTASVQVLNAAAQTRAGDHETETDGYTRWDMAFNYQLPQWFWYQSAQVFVQLNNLTDEEVRLSTSFLRNYAPEAGRSVVGGLRVYF